MTTATNTTRSTVLASDVELANNFWTRFKGLMMRPSLAQGHGLWLEPCKDIHSFFMKFEFDALYINKEGEVIHTVERMKPWRMAAYKPKGHGVLELPAGTIEATGTVVGDRIEMG